MADSEFKDLFEDMAEFLAWLILGVIVGWIGARIAHGVWFQSPLADLYGMAGAGLAVLWANFRRMRHLEHLTHLKHMPHVRKHLETMAAKVKKTK